MKNYQSALTLWINMKLGLKQKKILKIDNETYKLSLEFSDGFKGGVNLKFLFENPKRGTLPLEIKRGNLFSKCFIESGALAWPNGYELCPNAIVIWILEQKKLSRRI